MFSVGFEKTAGLKHWLTAAAVAASPMKARAGDALSTLRDAVGKTTAVKNMEQNARAGLENQFKKLTGTSTTFRIAGDVPKKGVTPTQARPTKPTIDLHDGHRLELGYKNLRVNAKPGETEATLHLPKGVKLNIAERGGERSANIGFEREF